MAISPERQKHLETIRKLLLLARDGGATVEEASTAAAKARSLMQKYNLDNEEEILAEIATANDALVYTNVWAQNTAYNKNTVEKFGFRGKFVPPPSQWLATATARMYDCECAFANDLDYGKCIRFYGYKDDVIITRWTFEYLMDMVRRETKDYLAKLPRHSGTKNKKEGISFRTGMVLTLTDRIYAMIAEQEKNEETSTALVVAKNAAITAKFGEFNYSKMDELKELDSRAVKAGQDAGQVVNIKPNVVTNGDNPSYDVKVDKRRKRR